MVASLYYFYDNNRNAFNVQTERHYSSSDFSFLKSDAEYKATGG